MNIAAAQPSRPRYSFVIPVWHEEEAAPAVVRRVRELDTGGLCEVIVADGDPDGSTLRTIDDPGAVKLTAPKGRALQMNAGAARARGSVIVFLHADTKLPDSMLADINEVLESGASCGAFRIRFDSPRRIYGFMSWFVTTATRFTRKPYGDQAIFVTDDLFRRIGGFRAIPVMEDVEFVGRIRQVGIRLKITRSAVCTSCRRMDAEGIASRVARNWWMKSLFHLGVSPKTLSRWYTDHHRVAESAPEGEIQGRVVLSEPGDSP